MIMFLACGCGEEERDRDTASREPSASVLTHEADSDSMSEHASGLPRLVDIGRNTCIPCKMMAPILEEIKREYEGRVVVEIVDLREDEGAAADYGVRLIPTQIFFDARGEEVWRHEGFLPKDAIVAKFTEMGVPSRDR